MGTADRKDPLPVFCFEVKLGGGITGFFKSVSGLKSETESIPVREGGVNDTTFMLVGATKWSPIILKNGFTNDSELLDWRNQWVRGNKMTRLSGVITQLNTNLKAVAQWEFVRGWPSKWELAELDASKSELAIETLEITHEGINYKRL